MKIHFENGLLLVRWKGYMDFWGWVMNSSYSAQTILGTPIVVYKEDRNLNKEMMNHESIHVRQALEMLYLPFWIMYIGHWLINKLFKGMDADTAYRNIIFEKEAYQNDKNFNYLKDRKFWSWTKYSKK